MSDLTRKSITDRPIAVRRALEGRCQQCGKQVQHYAEDGKRRRGSLWMAISDKKDRFCTMRCAAEWALAHVEQAII
jgi:hypothetical protein